MRAGRLALAVVAACAPPRAELVIRERFGEPFAGWCAAIFREGDDIGPPVPQLRRDLLDAAPASRADIPAYDSHLFQLSGFVGSAIPT